MSELNVDFIQSLTPGVDPLTICGDVCITGDILYHGYGINPSNDVLLGGAVPSCNCISTQYAVKTYLDTTLGVLADSIGLTALCGRVDTLEYNVGCLPNLTTPITGTLVTSINSLDNITIKNCCSGTILGSASLPALTLTPGSEGTSLYASGCIVGICGATISLDFIPEAFALCAIANGPNTGAIYACSDGSGVAGCFDGSVVTDCLSTSNLCATFLHANFNETAGIIPGCFASSIAAYYGGGHGIYLQTIATNSLGLHVATGTGANTVPAVCIIQYGTSGNGLIVENTSLTNNSQTILVCNHGTGKAIEARGSVSVYAGQVLYGNCTITWGNGNCDATSICAGFYTINRTDSTPLRTLCLGVCSSVGTTVIIKYRKPNSVSAEGGYILDILGDTIDTIPKDFTGSWTRQYIKINNSSTGWVCMQYI